MIRHIFFFFNDTATTEIYTLSLHDALPIFRDAAFTLYALISIGFDEEAANFMGWLQDRCASDRDGLLQPLYGIDGRAHIQETELDHLSGYRGSRPVRLGNAAYRPVQLDLYGAILEIGRASCRERV